MNSRVFKRPHEEIPSSQTILPETGFIRIPQIIGDPKADPPLPAIVPVSRSTLWNMVKEGRFPRPVKLGPRITVWRVEDVRAFIENAATSQES